MSSFNIHVQTQCLTDDISNLNTCLAQVQAAIIRVNVSMSKTPMWWQGNMAALYNMQLEGLLHRLGNGRTNIATTRNNLTVIRDGLAQADQSSAQRMTGG